MSDDATKLPEPSEADAENSQSIESQDQAPRPAQNFLSPGLRGVEFERAVRKATRPTQQQVSAPDEKPAGETDDGQPRKRTQFSGFDFIDTYADYADVIEAPREAHELVAIQMLATTLNPSVSIQFGGIPHSLDLWLVLLSSSGGGRNTLVSFARPILNGAGLHGLIRNDSWGSKQAVYQTLAEHPSGMYIFSELSELLKKLNDPKFGGVKEFITDRYDNFTVPEAIRYRITGKKADTPPIIFTKAPRLNILATSSLEWFTSNLAQGDAEGGFVPRWLMTQARGTSKVVPIPRTPDPSLVRPLGDHLQKISTLTGVADMSAVEDVYDKWYRDARQRFEAQPNRALAIPFFNRLRTHVLKLALVYHVSESPDLCVSPHAMERAIEKADQCRDTIFSLLPTGMNKEGAEVHKMLERIRLAGADGLLKSVFTKAFSHIRSHERDGRLSTLIQSADVVRFWRDTSGRQAEVLVHKDYAAEYADRYPLDRRES